MTIDYSTEQKGMTMNGASFLFADAAARQAINNLDQGKVSTATHEALANRVTELEELSKNKVDYIIIDENISDPYARVYGDVRGAVIRWIRENSHRVLGKYTAENTMTICPLNDANGAQYAEDFSTAALDGSQGDVFMQLPKFFTHANEVTTGVWRIGFARYQVTAEWKKWGEDDLIGVYEGYVSSNKLYSRSGVASTGSVSQADFKTYARARGTGFTAVKWKHQNIMGILYYAYYGNTNCQAEIGFGTNSYTKNTGLCDSFGMKDTNSASGNGRSINFWGLENWWGNKYEWVDNVNINGNMWSITEDDGTVRNVTGQSTYNNWVYPSHYVLGQNLDLIPKPTQSGGSDSTGYCDGIYMSGADARVVLRSYYYSSSLGGVGCAGCSGDSSYASAGIGSRLAFKGTIVKAASVSDYKAATAIG